MPTVQEALEALGVKKVADLASGVLKREAFLGPWAIYRDTCFWDPRYEPWSDPLQMKPFVAMVLKAFKEGISQSDCKDTKNSLDLEYHQSLLFSSLLRNLMQQGEVFHSNAGHEEGYPGLIKALRKLTTGVLVKHYRDNRGLGVIVEQARPSKLHLEMSVILRKGDASITKDPPKERSKTKPTGRRTSSNISGDQRQDDADAVIRCVCKRQHDDGGMIRCDRCNVWQHMNCMGVRGQEWKKKTYYCEQCRLNSTPSTLHEETNTTTITAKDARTLSRLSPKTISPLQKAPDSVSLVLKHDSPRPQSQTEPELNPPRRTSNNTDRALSTHPLLLPSATVSQATPISHERNVGGPQPALCHHCGASNHAARDCQGSTVTCSVCDMVGHNSNHCPRSALTRGLAAATPENLLRAPKFIEFQRKLWTPAFLNRPAPSIVSEGLSTQAQTQTYNSGMLTARPASMPPAQLPLGTQLREENSGTGLGKSPGLSSANVSDLDLPPPSHIRSRKRLKSALTVRVPASNELGHEQQTIMVEHNGKRNQFVKPMGSLNTANPEVYYSSSGYATETARRLQLSEVPQRWEQNAPDVVQDTSSTPTEIDQHASNARGVRPAPNQGSSPHPTLRDLSTAKRLGTLEVNDYPQTFECQTHSPRLLRPPTSHEVARNLLTRSFPVTTRNPTLAADRSPAFSQGASSPTIAQPSQYGSQPSIGHEYKPHPNYHLAPPIKAISARPTPARLHSFEKSEMGVNHRAISQPPTLFHRPPVAMAASTINQYSMQHGVAGSPSTHQLAMQHDSTTPQTSIQRPEQMIGVTSLGPDSDPRQHTPSQPNIVRTPSQRLSPRVEEWTEQLRILYAKRLQIGGLCRAIARGDSTPRNYAQLKIAKREYVDKRDELLGYNCTEMTRSIDKDFPLPSKKPVETDWVDKT